MRGENGAAVKKSGTKKTIEDVRTVNKKINSKSLDNDKVSKSTRKKVKCELTPENIMKHMALWVHIMFQKKEKKG